MGTGRRHGVTGARKTAAVVVLVVVALAVHASTADPAPGLVDAAWLEARLGDPTLVVLDARPSLRGYLAGHVPGAQALTVDNLRSSAAGVPGEIFPVEVVTTIAGRLGIAAGSTVVVYGADNDPDASFVAGVMRRYGLGRVALLDGGLSRWTAEGRPMTQARPRVAVTSPDSHEDPDAVASHGDVLRSLADGRTVVLDVRPPEQYAEGHIPGAISRFWELDLEPASSPRVGLFKAESALRDEYEALGIGSDTPVVVYCNTGHMASVVWFDLRYRLGLKGARLYDGSWVEWSQRAGAAIEKARSAASALTADLSARLVTELAAGGPARAIPVCAEVAPSIAREYSRDGTSVRRVSLKVRNPADAPDDWERARLERLERADDPAGEIVESAAVEGRGVLRYMKTIRVAEPCLQCHGPREGLDPEVARLLEATYPDDRAVGYRPGDVRGAVSVIVPLDD